MFLYQIFVVLVSVSYTKSTALHQYQQKCLDLHNQYRSWHQAGNLTWNQTLANNSMDYVEIMFSRNKFSSSMNQGENGFVKDYANTTHMCTSGAFANCTDVKDAMETWYNEHLNYDYEFGINKKDGYYKNFTQIVWKATRELGCACVNQNGRMMCVTRYSPKGNVMPRSHFVMNVFPILMKTNKTDSSINATVSPVYVRLIVSVKLSNVAWDEKFNDMATNDYELLKNNTQTSIFEALSLRIPNLRSVEVTGFTNDNGKVVVEFEVKIDSLKADDGDFACNIVVTQIRDAKLGKYVVDKSAPVRCQPAVEGLPSVTPVKENDYLIPFLIVLIIIVVILVIFIILVLCLFKKLANHAK